ncbi:MAG: hypothetical protein KKA64_00610 [Nanoarchaeota archaeon]|nr:hypothetical protein [Nanoarchaeota archaeon]
MWQDVVIAIVNVLFAYSLVYQVYVGFRDKKGFLSLQTSILTTIGLYAVAFVYFSLNLYLSTIISFFNGGMWFLLLFQRLVYKKA